MGMPSNSGTKNKLNSNFGSVVDAFLFIGSFINFERSKKQTIRDYRLDRMKELLAHFGNPDKSLKIIHLAGSKGKGSTAMFIASALIDAGLKTGLYSSPHITDYRERISLGGKFFDDKTYVDAAEEIKTGLETFSLNSTTGSSEPTTFELLTLMAFLIFKKTGCSWAVIETGIGGRLDATNVITPEVSIITHIEMEHADILGNTLEKIAFEKAGIIKKGVPVFSEKQSEIVVRVLKDKSKEMSSSLIFPDDTIESFDTIVSLEGSKVSFKEKDGNKYLFNLSAIGNVQAENSLLAWIALKSLLQPEGIRKQLLIEGINRAKLPGRFEVRNTINGTFIFDGAHTPVSVRRLMETWSSLYADKGILIFGSVADKNPEEMARLLSPYFNSIIISTPGTFKESYPEDVFRIFKKFSESVRILKDPVKAYKTASQLSGKDTPILVTGSFYMVSEIRKLALNIKK